MILKNFYIFVVYYTLLNMKGVKFGSKKRGPKGEGRAVIYKPVQLPVELIEDLKLYKEAYGMLLAEEEHEWAILSLCMFPMSRCSAGGWTMSKSLTRTSRRNGRISSYQSRASWHTDILR